MNIIREQQDNDPSVGYQGATELIDVVQDEPLPDVASPLETTPSFPSSTPSAPTAPHDALLSAMTHLYQTVEAVLTELKLPRDHPAMRHFAAAAEQVEEVWAEHGMAVIPAGEFLMGSVKEDEQGMASEKPPRQVYLDAYAIDILPVTVAQYHTFCHATGHPMPSEPTWGWRDDHPIVNVSWFDAAVYAAWIGKRLPTEAEWEKAARGTDGRFFPAGNAWDPAHGRFLVADGPEAGTAPVGSYPAGASHYGVLDMAGNIWEWCADWYDPYYYLWAPRRNPHGPETGQTRVLRGGSWRCGVPAYLRCAYRNFSRGPATWYNDRGFRCARSL